MNIQDENQEHFLLHDTGNYLKIKNKKNKKKKEREQHIYLKKEKIKNFIDFLCRHHQL